MEDRYEILDKIGAGGMSDVYKAKDHKLNRFVAIKFLKQEYCEDKTFVAKFQIEAQSAAALLHPNVVSVYDVNEADGIYYIVMEFVDGITLKRYIDRNGRLPIKEATSIAIQVGQGIEAAHNANIIHRDIKPQNVLISREGKIKVTDFGIARTTTANTISQDILGSVHYISPEQARGGQVDERSDIYSFGIVFYEMVTGELPFDGDSTVSIALKHIQESVPLVSDIVDGVPSSVVRIIEKCTQKKPERRYQKMSSLLADLKTSLISPNEDFVVLEPETQENATILMTDADARVIRESGNGRRQRAAVQDRYDDEYDEYDDRYDEYDEYDEYDDYEDEYDDGNGKKKDPSRKKLDKILLICGIVAGAIILIVLGVVTIRAITSGTGGCGGSSKNKEVVEMIDVVGSDAQTAKSRLEELGLTVELKYETSDTVEEEHVISQSVKAGTKIDAKTKVTLIVSSGQDAITLANYAGKTQSEAQEDLIRQGIQVKVTTKYSDDVETGKVIETNPKAGEKISKSTVVELIVSRGKETKQVTVPQLVGSSQGDAEAALINAGFHYNIVTQEAAGQGGIVINQSLAAGSSVEEGSEITITVGVEPQTEPPTPEPPTDPPEPDTTEEGG
ncbi:MAG: Stk1 family PASTA domain-containing Ser/Thr kinase [Lachnospiraceae bacterium]|nr:Stk1 family PASTA domain-containing Ser/Thr kinase [Lachnospiraceae bacterium]